MGVEETIREAFTKARDYKRTWDEYRAAVAKGDQNLIPPKRDLQLEPLVEVLEGKRYVHDKWPSWSPDGSQIAYISDKSGEEELYIEAQDGSKPAEQITQGGSAMRYAPEWAPDGKRIAFSDKDGKVYVVTMPDRKLVEIADSRRGQVRDYAWSPKGNYLAFSMGL